MDLQQELAVFLRTRREHLDPIEIGLPARQRRRTPGLRREEVAELAGISVDYLIRLEQGRGARPSRDVLDALARALQLDDAGHAHLFDLAGHGVARRPAVAERPPTGLARLIEQLSPLPAILLDRRFDILAWNPEMIGVVGVDFAQLPPRERNLPWLSFLEPAVRDAYLDREPVLRQLVAHIRARMAAQPEAAALADLVAELQRRSEEFARYWALGDVHNYRAGPRRYLHPRFGPLTLDREVLMRLDDENYMLIVYQAADPASQAVLDAIARDVRAVHR